MSVVDCLLPNDLSYLEKWEEYTLYPSEKQEQIKQNIGKEQRCIITTNIDSGNMSYVIKTISIDGSREEMKKLNMQIVNETQIEENE